MKKIEALFSKKRNKMDKWKELYLNHIKGICLGVLGGTFILPLLILLVIKVIDSSPWFFWDIARLENGTSVWLSFWGSYIGAIATILIAFFTLRLTLKNDISAKDNELNQLASSLHRFEVKSIRLYDLTLHYPVEELEHFDKYIDDRYLIRIEFCQPFPPYFKLQIDEFKWGNVENNIDVVKPMEFKVEYESNEQFVMFFLLDKSNDLQGINELYYINYFETQVMSKKERRHRIMLGLTCESRMCAIEHTENENKFELELEIEVENVSDYQEDYVELRTIQRRLNYCRLAAVGENYVQTV